MHAVFCCESLKTEDWQENLDKVEAFKLIKSSCDQSRNWKDLQGFALNDNELSEENLDAFLDLLSRDNQLQVCRLDSVQWKSKLNSFFIKYIPILSFLSPAGFRYSKSDKF